MIFEYINKLQKEFYWLSSSNYLIYAHIVYFDLISFKGTDAYRINSLQRHQDTPMHIFTFFVGNRYCLSSIAFQVGYTSNIVLGVGSDGTSGSRHWFYTRNYYHQRQAIYIKFMFAIN